MRRTHNRTCRADAEGFALVELMVVVLIIGILVTIAVPVYAAARERAMRHTCYANQRILEGAAETWVAHEDGRYSADLAGPIDAAHPVVTEHILGRAPTCPAAPRPADVDNPTPAEGAYAFDVGGDIEACPFHAHGHY